MFDGKFKFIQLIKYQRFMTDDKLSVKMYDSYCILMFSCYYENIPFDVNIPYVYSLASDL